MAKPDLRQRMRDMKRDVRILIAEDDDGHYSLVEKNLRRAGICNPISRFTE